MLAAVWRVQDKIAIAIKAVCPIYSVVNYRIAIVRQFAGEYTARATPVPIPNTEVKSRWADGTARVTVWEIRWSPA